LTVTVEIGPPVAETFTVVFGATAAAPLPGVIFNVTEAELDEDDELEEDELEDEPLPAGVSACALPWQLLTSTRAAAAAAAAQPAR